MLTVGGGARDGLSDKLHLILSRLFFRFVPSWTGKVITTVQVTPTKGRHKSTALYLDFCFDTTLGVSTILVKF